MTTTIHRNAVHPRYLLHDTVTGERHNVTYGDPILASVTSSVNQFAMDAMPKDARGNAWLPGSQLEQSKATGVAPRGRLPPSQQHSSNMLRGYGSTNMPPPNDPMLSQYRNDNDNRDQMPTPPSTPMRSSDQAAMSPGDVLDLIQLCLRHFQTDELQRNEFLQGLADLLEGEVNAHSEEAIAGRLAQRANGNDQLPNVGPLAARGGNNLVRMTQSSNRGTFSRHEQDDDLWQERAIDRGARRNPRNARAVDDLEYLGGRGLSGQRLVPLGVGYSKLALKIGNDLSRINKRAVKLRAHLGTSRDRVFWPDHTGIGTGLHIDLNSGYWSLLTVVVGCFGIGLKNSVTNTGFRRTGYPSSTSTLRMAGIGALPPAARLKPSLERPVFGVERPLSR